MPAVAAAAPVAAAAAAAAVAAAAAAAAGPEGDARRAWAPPVGWKVGAEKQKFKQVFFVKNTTTCKRFCA